MWDYFGYVATEALRRWSLTSKCQVTATLSLSVVAVLYACSIGRRRLKD